MCVVSMVMTEGLKQPADWWVYRQPITTTYPPTPPVYPNLEFFNELLRKAAEYDKIMKQPDCENDAKKKKLQDLADELGIEIKFPE